MFTGIVEEIGTLETLTPLPGGEARLQLRGPLAASDARLGDSIAVDGVCLTVVDLTGDGGFAVDAVPETLRRTALRDVAPGARVNLERALRADARLGGHIVQGHVDGVATLRSRRDGGRWVDLVFAIDPALAPLIAEKGAITVSGVSLTVTSAGEDSFGVSLIPATLEATTLGGLVEGGLVNIEVDVLARYVARLQQTGAVGADAPDQAVPDVPDVAEAPDVPEVPEAEAARR
ncbi:riboflavin synthase [Brachybacterium kimchii]|uniref:Riboflavin synthase n=1 Tax=Brachybacterium kimchii TaxID=2942909 RepID=A0ABY4N119_9MICO|nr:riboflavin synthase [Brachybacterium kimchii]UQN28227.1 riboflavin synthase [Brachybacterium kimchii]